MSTTHPPTRSAIDALIPPPWGGPRRTVAGVAVIVAIALLMGAWWFGLLGPRLAPVTGYDTEVVDDPGVLAEVVAAAPNLIDPAAGVDGVVAVEVTVGNPGLPTIEGLRLGTPGPVLSRGAMVPNDPVDVPPGGEVTVTFHLVIEDCTQLWAPDQPVSYSAISGPFRHDGRSVPTVALPHLAPTWPNEADLDDPASWWYALAQPVCDPDAVAAETTP